MHPAPTIASKFDKIEQERFASEMEQETVEPQSMPYLVIQAQNHGTGSCFHGATASSSLISGQGSFRARRPMQFFDPRLSLAAEQPRTLINKVDGVADPPTRGLYPTLTSNSVSTTRDALHPSLGDLSDRKRKRHDSGRELQQENGSAGFGNRKRSSVTTHKYREEVHGDEKSNPGRRVIPNRAPINIDAFATPSYNCNCPATTSTGEAGVGIPGTHAWQQGCLFPSCHNPLHIILGAVAMPQTLLQRTSTTWRPQPQAPSDFIFPENRATRFYAYPPPVIVVFHGSSPQESCMGRCRPDMTAQLAHEVSTTIATTESHQNGNVYQPQNGSRWTVGTRMRMDTEGPFVERN